MSCIAFLWSFFFGLLHWNPGEEDLIFPEHPSIYFLYPLCLALRVVGFCWSPPQPSCLRVKPGYNLDKTCTTNYHLKIIITEVNKPHWRTHKDKQPFILTANLDFPVCLTVLTVRKPWYLERNHPSRPQARESNPRPSCCEPTVLTTMCISWTFPMHSFSHKVIVGDLLRNEHCICIICSYALH